MLEGLDEVDWSSLQHAYGPATDVPGLIRDLTSSRRKRRERALFELYGNIWHQHTVYEATARAVPYLVEIALADEVPAETRYGVLMLLAEIADGESYVDVHAPLFEDMEIELPTEPGQLERELEWVSAAHEAVHRDLSRLARYLDAPDENAHVVASYLVSKFPEDAEVLATRLEALFEEAREPLVRQAMAFALVTIGRAGEEHVVELESLDIADETTLADVVAEARAGRADHLTSAVFAELVEHALG